MPQYNVEAKRDFAAQMRRKPTAAEHALWQRLRRKQTGFLFHRQSLQLGYILDFYCRRPRLAIEVDGSVHDLRQAEDLERDQALADKGIKVLRFTNQDVLDFPTVVMHRITEALRALSGETGRGGSTNPDSSSSRGSASVDVPATSRKTDDWANLRNVLNLPQNLCRPKEIPPEQRLTRESAEQIAGACKELLMCDRQRRFSFDNRTSAEKAFDQKYRLQEWIKKRAEAAALAVTGMHVTERKA